MQCLKNLTDWVPNHNFFKQVYILTAAVCSSSLKVKIKQKMMLKNFIFKNEQIAEFWNNFDPNLVLFSYWFKVVDRSGDYWKVPETVIKMY